MQITHTNQHIFILTHIIDNYIVFKKISKKVLTSILVNDIITLTMIVVIMKILLVIIKA